MQVLISDDHAIVREGLKQLVLKIEPKSIIEETQDGSETLFKIENSNYDLIILDISMPGKSGLEILKILQERNISSTILMLSIHSQEHYAARAFQLGAAGYLSKDSVYKELESAIKVILSGKKYVSSAFAQSLLLDRRSDKGKTPHEKLSPREFQIMCLLARGIGVKEISENLSISDKTVSTHRMRLLQKMGMKKNAELTHYAINNNLIE